MPVKLTSTGKIILKSGKVSCTCCEPFVCCPYPAQAFYDGLYPADDLPDAIELTCEAGTYVLTKSGPTFTDGTIVVDNYFNPLYNRAIWRVTHPMPPFLGCATEIGDCLITAGISEDQFAGQYTGTYGAYDPIALIRSSLCEWLGDGIGTESQEYSVRLYYANDYKWHIALFIDGVNYDWIKDDPQSSPVGDFETNFQVSL